jgi:energy-coupling factor transport system permease protein
MRSDIIFGQYVEGDSLFHRFDARIKILTSILFIVTIFLAKSLTAFALIFVSITVFVIMTHIPVRMMVKAMRPLLFIIIFTALINILWFKGETLLVQFWIISIYLEGIINAGIIIFRILVLITATSVFLTYTTTPLALTDALESLLKPLKLIHVPVHEFAMMMTIALRFIPTLIDETHKIINAQTARGADFASGGVIKRAKALIPILIPLFVSAFRRADELATAMECRCYSGGEGRTKLNVPKTDAKDWVFFGIVIAIGVAVVLLNIYFPVYTFAI